MEEENVTSSPSTPVHRLRHRRRSNEVCFFSSLLHWKKIEVRLLKFLVLVCVRLLWMGIEWMQVLCWLMIEISTNLSWSGLTLLYGWLVVLFWLSTWDISISQLWWLLSKSLWLKSCLICWGKHLRINVFPGLNSWIGKVSSFFGI